MIECFRMVQFCHGWLKKFFPSFGEPNFRCRNLAFVENHRKLNLKVHLFEGSDWTCHWTIAWLSIMKVFICLFCFATLDFALISARNLTICPRLSLSTFDHLLKCLQLWNFEVFLHTFGIFSYIYTDVEWPFYLSIHLVSPFFLQNIHQSLQTFHVWCCV